MSFKSYDCHVTGLIEPFDEFRQTNEFIFVDAAGVPQARYGCDPSKSQLIGVVEEIGMGEDDYYQFLALLMVLLVTAYGIKALRQMMGY